MKKLKSFISCLLAVIILLSACSMASFALVSEEEFNIENITWEDIMTMSNSDFRKLLSDFERVYDPFGTYETNPIMTDYQNQYGYGVQPYWTSGEEDLSEIGSHELITARACGILLDDKGFWGEDRNSSILIALTLSLASIQPDKVFSLGLGHLYKGHFYDPDTGENFLKEKTDTAKTNAEKYFKEAVKHVSNGDYNDDFIKYAGYMIHYVQDACEPHHAANMKAGITKTAHGEFEKFADTNLNSYIDGYKTISQDSYTNAIRANVGDLVHGAAVRAKSYIGYVDDYKDQSMWDTVAYHTTRNAVLYTSIILYKLSIETGLKLNK